MNDVMGMIGNFLLLVLTAITVENAVLSRALGLSRLISLVDDTTNTVIFSVLLTATTTISGILYYFLYFKLIEGMPGEIFVRVFGVVLCMSVSFLLVFVLAVKLMPFEHVGKAAEAMPAAAFNCMVFGTVVLAVSEKMTLGETVVFSIGSSIGFTLAILLVTEGQRKLQNRDIPAAFKGLPATLLYLAGLAIAVYGLTGHTFSL